MVQAVRLQWLFNVIVTLISRTFRIGFYRPNTNSYFVDIRIQQRNGRKTLTTVQGLPKDLDPKKVLKVFKKEFACNGTIVEDEEMGEVIQLQGDHRAKVGQILIEEGICAKDGVQIHGF